nr:FtsX-like permease family protein [Mordavella massiliensis]
MAVGYAGILKLFFLKRRSELAICSACGAPRRSIVKEVILEIAAICLGGCVIGTGVGTILTETVELGLPVRPDLRSCLIALVLALTMTFLQSVLVLLPLKQGGIYAALRETGK